MIVEIPTTFNKNSWMLNTAVSRGILLLKVKSF